MDHLLKRIIGTDGFLEDVKKNWTAQINADDDGMPVEQLDVYFNQAVRISSNTNVPDDKGMFVLVAEDDETLSYDAMCYINHAFVKNELRVVNIYLAPRFDDREHMQINIARVFAHLLSRFVSLARHGKWQSSSLKMYLPDTEFRNFASLFASQLQLQTHVLGVEIIGNWLHISGLDTLQDT